MGKIVRLKKEELSVNFNDILDFSNTKEISPYEGIIGQERGIESIELGLNIDRMEYNIFISGRRSTGKTSYIVKKIEEHAKNLPSPKDWCYVYNFKDDKKPKAISLNTATGLKFKDDIENFIHDILKEAPVFFNDTSYVKEKNDIIRKYEKLISNVSKQLYAFANELNFSVKKNKNKDFVFIPMKDDKEMDEELYENLSQSDKDELNKNLNELRVKAFEIENKADELTKSMTHDLNELNDNIAEKILKDKVKHLQSIYEYNDEITEYLNMLKTDVIKNIDKFIEEEEEKEKYEIKKEFFKRYKVNVIVSNKKNKGAPVVFEDSPEYSNIFGKIEYENDMRSIVTDFTMIQPGSIHEANFGYLIINAEKLLNNKDSWKSLKKCLKSQKIILENAKSSGNVPLITLRPQDIPLKVKVILIGSSFTYSLLDSNDFDFKKLFKIKAEFDNEIENEKENILKIIGFISGYIKEHNTLHVTKNGVIELLRYSSRICGSKHYFTARMSKLLQILDIANIFAKKYKESLINDTYIKKAILEFKAMHGLYKKKTLQMYKNKKYIVNTKGKRVGEVNGLSVMDYGDAIIGRQHKITVTTFVGKKGIINIEREANMSGKIHNKGIMILSGYIGALLGQDTPMSFNASIVFEQLYSGIEGDSASAAELLALMSSLSDIPIKQSLAITGSINQKGEIQPIGGVNEKIEGYFDICSINKLDGTQGVIIPRSNVDDLVLEDRVIEATQNNLFNIYAVENIEECISILFDMNIDYRGISAVDKVKDRILVKMQKYNDLLKQQS